MRISDWSSDVCSSDLKAEEGQAVVRPAVLVRRRIDPDRERHHPREDDGGERYDESEEQPLADDVRHRQVVLEGVAEKIGRESSREKECQEVENWVVAGPLNERKEEK